jgi:hypothetical protein
LARIASSKRLAVLERRISSSLSTSFTADDCPLQLLGAKRKTCRLADQIAFHLGDVAARLSLIGGTDVAESARCGASTINTRKQPRAIADTAATCRAIGGEVGANTLHSHMMRVNHQKESCSWIVGDATKRLHCEIEFKTLCAGNSRSKTAPQNSNGPMRTSVITIELKPNLMGFSGLRTTSGWCRYLRHLPGWETDGLWDMQEIAAFTAVAGAVIALAAACSLWALNRKS